MNKEVATQSASQTKRRMKEGDHSDHKQNHYKSATYASRLSHSAVNYVMLKHQGINL